MAYPATPKTWISGDVLTAAQLNAELRDALLAAFPNGITATWQTWTPTLTQSGAVTKTVNYARYFKIGRLVTAQFILFPTAAGTAANPVKVGLPITAAQAGNLVVGSGFINDASANLNYSGVAVLTSVTECALISTTAPGINYLGQTDFTAALASGDAVIGLLSYEAAT